jgi:predicted transcriptional regulator
MRRHDTSQTALGARSRAVLDVIYRLGEISGPDLMRELPELPSYSALRSILRALEAKGLIRHRMDGPRYVFRPTMPKSQASRNALRRVLDTYFGGMPEPALKALLDVSRDRRHDVDYDSLQQLIDEARKGGK